MSAETLQCANILFAIQAGMYLSSSFERALLAKAAGAGGILQLKLSSSILSEYCTQSSSVEQLLYGPVNQRISSWATCPAKSVAAFTADLQMTSKTLPEESPRKQLCQ